MKSKIILIFLLFFSLCMNVYSQKFEIKSLKVDGNVFLVKENAVTKSPHRVYDIKNRYPIDKFKKGTNIAETIDFSKKIFKDLEKITRFSVGDLELSSTTRTDEFLTATFNQKYKGLHVLNSEVGFTISNDGELASFGADFYYDINVSNIPSINKNYAINQVKNNLDSKKYSISTDPELVIYPKTSDKSVDYFLIWNIIVFDSTRYEKSAYYINAQNGDVIERISLTKNAGYFGGTLKYKYFPLHHTDTPAILTWSNTAVKIYNGIGQKCDEPYTNVNGYYSTSNSLAYATYYVYIPLKNSFVEVRDRNVLAIEYIYNFNNTSPSNLVATAVPSIPKGNYDKTWDACDATNLYYHVNVSHDYFKNTFYYNSMDYSMVAVFDAAVDVNGQADGTDIFFGYQGGQFWARAADVIYHEYSHNVIHHLYNGFIGNQSSNQASAMDEGLADFFACNLTNDSYFGESVGLVRNLNNNYSWNAANNKYYNGQVIGGACWDLRNTVGQNTSEQLVFKALQLSPKARNFQDFLDNLLLADILLYNGTNRTIIINAFNNHSIQPEIMSASMAGPTSLLPNQTGTWNVGVSGGVPPYTYSWSYFKPCSQGSGASAAPCGYWYDLYVTSNSLSTYATQDIELKCLVTDAMNQTSAASLYINVSSALASNLNNSISKTQVYEIYVPTEFTLYQNYPNPFNPTTTIKFALPEARYISINIYNSIGQSVEKLASKYYQSGYHSVVFDASNLPSGIYFYRIDTGKEILTKQMILVK